MKTIDIGELQEAFTQKELSAAEHMSDRTAKIMGILMCIITISLVLLYVVYYTIRMWAVYPNLWRLQFIKYSLGKLYFAIPRDIEPLLWHFEKKIVLKEHLIKAHKLNLQSMPIFK